MSKPITKVVVICVSCKPIIYDDLVKRILDKQMARKFMYTMPETALIKPSYVTPSALQLVNNKSVVYDTGGISTLCTLSNNKRN